MANTVDAETEQRRAPASIAAAQITRSIVHLLSVHYGRGPTKAKTTIHRDVVVTVLADVYTPVERTFIRAGNFEQVRNMRLTFHDELGEEFRAIVEDALGCKVRAFLSQVHEDPPLATELFILDRDWHEGTAGNV